MKNKLIKKELLKKAVAILLTAGMTVSLTSCGGKTSDTANASSDNNGTQTTDTVTEESNGQSTDTDNTTSDTSNTTENGDSSSVSDSDVWAPDFLLADSGESSADDTYTNEIAIASKGTFLFSGATNEGYYPSDISWLTSASGDASLALAYACDDETHGGWGVLGGGGSVNGAWMQFDISAFADEPSKERVVIYKVSELAELLGASDISELGSFQIGAWNGGRIAGLYFLDEDQTAELESYMNSTDSANLIVHTYDGTLSDDNAIDSAVTLYSYLCDTYGTACLTGQMESTWKGSPDYEMNYIEENTGKLPAIRGLDFMNNDFEGVVLRAENWWEKGGIVTICWHTGFDFSSGYTECINDEVDLDKALTPGTEEYAELLAGMDRAVPYLQELEDAGVPVLWRPFHELDGGWFWWSKDGSENFVKLWKLMYCRYTDYWGLDNLIWVYGYSHNGVNMADWYPGDEYVDLIGGDSYDVGANDDLYEEVEDVAADGMPIVFHECGTIPTEEELKADDTEWLYFMVWHTDYLTDEKNNTKENLNKIYNGDYFITLDELPDFN